MTIDGQGETLNIPEDLPNNNALKELLKGAEKYKEDDLIQALEESFPNES